jgi:hypothetical protein
MKQYFILQYQMTNRKLKDFGVEPLLGYMVVLVAFIGFSMFLFYKTEFAQYIYTLVSLTFTSKLSEHKRNDFLKLCFNNKHYKLVRITENLLTSLPFAVFLIYKQIFISSIILILVSLVFALSSFKASLNFTIPTPFYKRPFEFTVGFRNTFYIFLLAYALTFIAIYVDNFNLGVFSILLIFLTVLSFYAQPENEYFVWSYKLSPKQFIIEKVKTALVFTAILCLPIVLSLCVFYYENIYAIVIFYAIGCLFLVTVIFAKYGAYPNEINFPEGIIIAISLSFPPLLFIFAPYFYLKAKSQLQQYLA